MSVCARCKDNPCTCNPKFKKSRINAASRKSYFDLRERIRGRIAQDLEEQRQTRERKDGKDQDHRVK